MFLLFFFEISAIGLQTTLVAFRTAGLAYIAAVKQEPVMRLGNDISGDIFDQLFLSLQGILAVGGQSQSFAHAEDMRVHSHGGLVPDDGADHVGRLASYAL